MTLISHPAATTQPWTAPAPGTASDSEQPFVTVIVPVYNDCARLGRCLEALEGQSYPRDRYEIIVVDNGSDEPLSCLVAGYSQVRLEWEPRPGSYAARNKGISVARGEVLAFTDSDCVPHPDWIARGVAALTSEPNCGMVGGRIDAVLSDPRHPSAIELYTAVMYWRQRPYIEVGHFSTTANLFTLRRVFDDVGPFDDSLKSGGDAIWGQQVFAAGYRQTYADDACVEHPTMSSWRELFSRTTRQAGGVRDIKRRSGAPYLAIKTERPGDLKLFVMQAGWILSDPRVSGLAARLKTLGVLVAVAHFVLLERLRLRLGGTSKR